MREFETGKVYLGDCIEVMRKFPENSVDAIVTDPPYGLEFMGLDFDSPKKLWTAADDTPWHRNSAPPNFDAQSKDIVLFQKWTEKWAREAIRILKPGAYALVMGGTRMFHRMACGLEDAGFEIADTCMWIYRQGFPKAQDLSKLIDKRAFLEWLSTKPHGLPPEQVRKAASYAVGGVIDAVDMRGGNYAQGVEEYGERGNNLRRDREEGARVLDEILKKFWNGGGSGGGGGGGLPPGVRMCIGEKRAGIGSSETYAFGESNDEAEETVPLSEPSTELAKKWSGFKIGGLKPAYEPIVMAFKPTDESILDNVLKHGVGALNIDDCRIPYEKGEEIDSGSWNKLRGSESRGDATFDWGTPDYVASELGRFPSNLILTDAVLGEQSRFFLIPKPSPSEKNAGLGDEFEEEVVLPAGLAGSIKAGHNRAPNPRRNIHETIKPVALFEHMIKLVAPIKQNPDCVVLDPFIGSGTTAIACRRLGIRNWIGIEKDSKYVDIANARIAHWKREIPNYEGEDWL